MKGNNAGKHAASADRAAARKKKKLGFTALFLVSMILSGLTVSGVFLHSLTPWLLGAAMAIFFWSVPALLAPTLTGNPAPAALLAVFKSIATAVAVAFLFIDFRYSLCISISLVLTVSELVIDDSLDRKNFGRYYFFDLDDESYLAIKILFITVGTMLTVTSAAMLAGGTAKYMIIALGSSLAFLIGGLVLLFLDTEGRGLRTLIAAVASGVVALVAITFLFVGREYAMMAFPLAIAAGVIGFIAVGCDYDTLWGLTGGIGGAAAFLLAFLMIFGWYGTKDYVIKDGTLTACYARDEEVVEIPEGVTAIGNKAFNKLGMRNWTNPKGKTLILPESLETIGYKALQKTSFTEVVLNEGLTSIGERAFYEASIKSVVIPDSVTYIGREAFFWSDLESATVGSGVKWLEAFTFASCYALSSVTLSEGLEYIGSYAFDYNNLITELVLPESLTTLEELSLANMAALTTLTIPNGVTKVGENAVYNCDALTSATVGAGVKTAPSNMFRGCKMLSEVTFLGVETLSKNSFYNCDSLAKVYLPTTVRQISEKVFNSCKNAITVNYAGTEAEWSAVSKDSDWMKGADGGVTVKYVKAE